MATNITTAFDGVPLEQIQFIPVAENFWETADIQTRLRLDGDTLTRNDEIYARVA